MDLPKSQGIKAKRSPSRVTAMTHLSDKECARVDDVQEVPEATVEGCLEKGWERRLDEFLYSVLQTMGNTTHSSSLLPVSHSPQDFPSG